MVAARVAATQARVLNERLARVAVTASVMADEMQFGFLLDPQRKNTSVAIVLPTASIQLLRPARLGSPARELRGDCQGRHRTALVQARGPVTAIRRDAALISWSGSMFNT
jgi:hypothetical protein